MKMMKRILSLLVALSMVLSIAPTWVFAAEDTYTGTRPTVLTIDGADGDSEYGSITITEGAVLTVADGVTLTIGGGRTDKQDAIINNGKLVLEGTGALVIEGVGICSETAVHCYQEGKCLICGMEAIGWTENGGVWYYYDPDTGTMATGISRLPYPTEAIGGVTYAPNEEDLAGDPAYGYTDSETALFVFDENGVFQNTLNGLYEGHWAVNGQLPWHVGLVQSGEDYYYFRGENQIATGNVYVGRNTTELEVVIGGVYTFGTDGKLLKYDGITDINGTLYYYDAYRLAMGAGLVKVDDNYYYVRSSGAVVVGQEYWVANVNGYTDIAPGFYTFDENGIMQLPDTSKNGVYAEDGGLYYYENGYRAYKGLIQYTDGENYNGEWIYVRSNGQLAVDSYWATRVNNSGMEEGMYTFDELGRMEAVKDGIVEENGGLYYYESGTVQYGLGLYALEDDSYIYVRSNGQLAVGRYWITNTNGIMEEGFQTFGEDGKMIVQ